MTALLIVANVSLFIMAGASIILAVIFGSLVKALRANTKSLKMLMDHLDSNLNATMESVQKSIKDINEITERVNRQMDRVETIMGNIEDVSRDARNTSRMVESTLVPTLTGLHSIAGGVRKAMDAWRAQRAVAREPENE